MLRPQENAVRERKRLDGVWRFRVDTEGQGRARGWPSAPVPETVGMAVPASYNDIYPDEATRLHVGSVWYETDVWVPRGWGGRRVTVSFESVTHRATVWADGVEVAHHEGGYTPFEADVTAWARTGEPLRLTVEVDNTLTFATIPPGVVLDTPHGKRQKYWHDFFNYAGIHRSVWLVATASTRVTDLTVTTELDADRGLVDYRTEVADGYDGLVVRAELSDGGHTVGVAEGLRGRIAVDGVTPWAPGRPHLYTLTVRLLAGDELVDEYRQRVGVRTVRVDGTRFCINDEPFHFTGVAMHEDFPVLGKGHHDAVMLHDFALLRWLGGNSIRTTHYPCSEDVLDLADELGIVVIDETAAVGLNMGIGGGVFGAQGYETYSPTTINATTQ